MIVIRSGIENREGGRAADQITADNQINADKTDLFLQHILVFQPRMEDVRGRPHVQ